MLSITTNLSSLIAQNSMKSSTNKLNQAIERMTTGAKINHAKDNAANYSIATNMTTKINAYQVAEDNCAMGLDMVTTASDSLDLISNHLSRLRSLAVQASNGTYGSKSLSAINSEATALINEIYRTKNTTTYNGIKVYGNSSADEQTVGAKDLIVNADGFLQDVNSASPISTYSVSRASARVIAMADVDETQTLAVGKYSISTAEELAKLATMQNSGKVEAGSEFVLTADIDLSAYSSGEGWTPIGGEENSRYQNKFSGTFDGQGHKITNLYINQSGNKPCQGLFGSAENAEFKNVSVEGDITSLKDNAGGLVGWLNTGKITNCNASVDINSSSGNVGGLVGYAGEADVDLCYATGNIRINSGSEGANHAGGLIGALSKNSITNSFATGNVITDGRSGAGLIGFFKEGIIDNCFATGDVQGETNSGGLIGCTDEANISNCHATGNVTSIDSSTIQLGGLVGCVVQANLSNCYATGNIDSKAMSVGGLVGILEKNGIIDNCFATGDVSGSRVVGGLIGDNITKIEIKNSYAAGNVTSSGSYSGGLCGKLSDNVIVDNCYATGNVDGNTYSGGLIGLATASVTNCYAKGCVNGSGNYVGGLVGYSTANTTLSGCSALTISSTAKGAIAGYSAGKIENCSYSSYYETKNISPIGTGSTKIDTVTILDATPYSYHENSTGLQIGTNGNDSSRIEFETAFSLGNLRNIIYTGIEKEGTIELLDNLISQVSQQQTKYGAVQNRLESALEEISTQYDNLVSSRSTIQDADIAEISSEYIRQQILQQASATLMATANQSPAIALQLL